MNVFTANKNVPMVRNPAKKLLRKFSAKYVNRVGSIVKKPDRFLELYVRVGLLFQNYENFPGQPPYVQ